MTTDLAALAGREPIEVRFVPSPRAHRGRLHMHSPRGAEIHAATFVRRRLMVLDEQLIAEPPELARIVVHELFHFVWPKLGNARRRSFEEVLAGELRGRARGELGWSSESIKAALDGADVAGRSRRWREYACESFCDTAAWLFGGLSRHEEFTLAGRWRIHRRRWFESLLGSRPAAIMGEE